jgi:hypothetical protein
MLAKIYHGMLGLFTRLTNTEKRVVACEHAIKQLRSSPSAAASMGQAYGFPMAPGSPGYGIVPELWVKVGSAVEGQDGVYNATVQIVAGVGQFAAHPDITGTVRVWRPDKGALKQDAYVLCRWEGRSEAGEDWYVVIGPSEGGRAIYGQVESVDANNVATVQPWPPDGSTPPTIKAWLGDDPWHQTGDAVVCIPADIDSSFQYVTVDKIQGLNHWQEPTVPAGGIQGDASNTLHSKQDAPNAKS